MKKIALLLFFITIPALAMKPVLPIKGTEQSWDSYLNQLVNFSIRHNQTKGLKKIFAISEFNETLKRTEYKNVIETEAWFKDQRIDVPTSIETLKSLLAPNEEK